MEKQRPNGPSPMSPVVTQETIAKVAGVSRPTVSMVISGRAKQARISDRKAAEIMAVAHRLKYRANAAARAMRSNRSFCVGVITLERKDVQDATPDNQYITYGINDGLQSEGYVLCMIRCQDVMTGDFAASRVFTEHMLDGVIVMSAFPVSGARVIKQYFSTCLWVDTTIWEPTRCLRRDEAAAGYDAAMALIDNGYKHLLYVGVDSANVSEDRGGDHYSFSRRRDGVERAARESGVSLEMIHSDVCHAPRPRTPHLAPFAPRGGDRVLQPGPDADHRTVRRRR